MSSRAIKAVVRLELAEVLRSRWLAFTLVVYVLLASAFILVGLRESTVVGFTGTGRVLLSFSHALVLLLPLLALSATAQVINGARASGSLELILSQPISRQDYFIAVALVRYLVLVIPLAVVTLGIAVFANLALGQNIPWGYLGRALAVGTTLLSAFVGLGLLVTTIAQSQAKAAIAVLVLWLGSVALLDFALVGAMLEWRVPPRVVFAMAAVNPVEAARLALIGSADPELGVLGPVGFYLATHLGQTGLMVLGLGWPVLVGLGAGGLAGLLFRRGDVV
ncbi:MAG: ABC transporter permease subunit [Deltaproteobacteria bacterium]|nr:ABC transporter permease subunit [Deltaproteobacteria bacterium]